VIVVESVAAQRYISQMVPGEISGVPVKDFNTGREKMSTCPRVSRCSVAEFGVEITDRCRSFRVEDMRSGRATADSE